MPSRIAAIANTSGTTSWVCPRSRWYSSHADSRNADQTRVVHGRDRLGAVLVGRDELERAVGGERGADDLGPARVLERLLHVGRLELVLRMVQPMPQRVDDLHVIILTCTSRHV